jgi:hypothetical protein
MSTKSKHHAVASDGFAKRAICALPLLVIPPFFYYAVTGIESESFWIPITERKIWVAEKPFNIADSFFGITFLDNIWRGAVTVLTVSTLGWDGPSWWQTFTFLVDVGTIHSVFLIEACRRGNVYRPAQLLVLYLHVREHELIN